MSASLELPFASFPPSESLELSDGWKKLPGVSAVNPGGISELLQVPFTSFALSNLLSSQMGGKGSPVFP